MKDMNMNIRSNEDTFELLQHLEQLVSAGEKLYIHCYGGHGRAGTISIPLLTSFYGIPASEALQLADFYHKIREGHNTGRCKMP